MKPWGELGWLLTKLPLSERPLYFLGSVASEERCCEGPRRVCSYNTKGIRLLRIEDPPSRYSERVRLKVDANLEQLRRSCASDFEVVESLLFADDDQIVSCLQSEFLEEPEVDLWIDLTALPKRFFFLLVKLAILDSRVRNLLALYAQPSPGRYADDHLAEDPADVQPLPGFGPLVGEPESLIVAIGFETLGLPQLMGEYRATNRDIRFLVPFPPGQPYSRRIWETVRAIGGRPVEPNIRRVPALDMFEAYRILQSEYYKDKNPPALAPYGPKPVSLAMCLFALEHHCPVYYTQPRLYHPDYSVGTGKIWGYCLKLAGEATWREG